MKANQKFLRDDDDAVSPVIAVILMVAITVVLAATVYVWVSGFGANSIIHTTHLLELSADLPVVIEVVDSEEHINRLLPILDEMLDDGLVTIEKVRVLRYKPSDASSV